MTAMTTERTHYQHENHPLPNEQQDLYSTRKIHRAFQMRGLSIQSTAVSSIQNVLRRETDPTDALHTLLEEVKRRSQKSNSTNSRNSRIITREFLEGVVSDLSRNDVDVAKESTQLLNAFEMPRLDYTDMNKVFRLLRGCDEKRELHCANATGKVDMFIQRYSLIHQRILQQEAFRPKLPTSLNTTSNTSSPTCKLSPIESLLGKPPNQTHTLLGTLIQVENQYHLEDLTSTIPLEFTNCEILSQGYLTETCTVLVEGKMGDGVFCVERMGHPPPEARRESLLGKNNEGGGGGGGVGVVNADIFGSLGSVAELNRVSEQEMEHGRDEMFVVLSNVHLDDEMVMEKLETLFEGFEGMAAANGVVEVSDDEDAASSQGQQMPQKQLPVFILMGNFTCQPLGHSQQNGLKQLTSLFDDLGSLIQQFPILASHGRFVFVPGPQDTGPMSALPFPPISKLVTNGLRNMIPHATFATNPCRLRFFTKEIVIYRNSIVNPIRRNSILPVRTPQATPPMDEDVMVVEEEEEYDVVQHAVKTILDQTHLSPLPLTIQPIYWQYDHALRLYPLPDAVILADDACVDPYNRVYMDTDVLHPGSFEKGEFVVYKPVVVEEEEEDGGMGEEVRRMVTSRVEPSRIE